MKDFYKHNFGMSDDPVTLVVKNNENDDPCNLSDYLIHEIKNPLSVIKNHLNLMEKYEDPLDKYYKPLKIINQEVDHILRLLHDAGLFSKSPELIFVRIELKKLINSIAEMKEEALKSKGITLINRLDNSFITADYLSTRIIFINMIDNSIDACFYNGEIIIYNTISGNTVDVFIKDNGKGIPHPDNIFQPFYTTKTGGTGLGLPIVYKLIKSCGGSVQLISGQKGETIFKLNFCI